MLCRVRKEIFTHFKTKYIDAYDRRKEKKPDDGEMDVQYVDKQRGIAVVLQGEGGDLKGEDIGDQGRGAIAGALGRLPG